ncbi:MAG: SDR family oxidoreductase [Planctomycetota bacterium]
MNSTKPPLNCLVTGGAGFIGSHLAGRLARDGHRVTVFDNFFTGTRENLREFAEQITIIEGDLRDAAAVVRAAAGANVIFHVGALPSVQRSIKEPVTAYAVNTEGTLNVLEAARAHRVPRLVFSSSSSVYGDTPVLPKHEDLPTNPLSPYASSKRAAEHLCQIYTRHYAVDTVCLRYFNVFGPRQNPKSEYAAVIPRFVTAALSGDRPAVFGDGGQTRDFTYVENVVDANLRAMRVDLGNADIMNICGGRKTSINELIRLIGEFAGKPVNVTHADPRPGEIRDSFGDITRAEKHLGYRPIVGLEEGLKRTVDYFRSLGVRESGSPGVVENSPHTPRL